MSKLGFESARHGTSIDFERLADDGLLVQLTSFDVGGKEDCGIAYWLTKEQSERLARWLKK